jgi:transcriptional regulator with XRE-family HTH domain
VSAANGAARPISLAEGFGEALKAMRVTYGFSHDKLARIVGKNKSIVKAWENGERRPMGRDLPRLIAAMPKLGPYMALLPKLPSAPADTILVVDTAELEPPTTPAPKSFGEALRQERLREGMDQVNLAELLGVHRSALGFWENATGNPSAENYQKLIELLPALGGAPAPPNIAKRLAAEQAAQADQAAAEQAAAAQAAADAEIAARVSPEVRAELRDEVIRETLADSSPSTHKFCPKCKKAKRREDEWGKNKSSADGLQSWCKDCQRADWNLKHSAAAKQGLLPMEVKPPPPAPYVPPPEHAAQLMPALKQHAPADVAKLLGKAMVRVAETKAKCAAAEAALAAARAERAAAMKEAEELMAQIQASIGGAT